MIQYFTFALAAYILQQNKRIAARVQIVVDKAFQNQSIPKKMLAYLAPYLEPQFDILFSVGLSSNPKKHAHIKAGWEIIHQDSKYFYVAYYFNCNERKILALKGA